MDLTTKFTQNDNGKVLIIVSDSQGKAYTSFYLKPRMINFVAWSSTPVMTIYIHREGDASERECKCDFSGLKPFTVSSLPTRRTVPPNGGSSTSSMYASHYAIKSPTGEWLDESKWLPTRVSHLLTSEAVAHSNKCSIPNCNKELPENVRIDPFGEACPTCDRVLNPPLPTTRVCINCRKPVPYAAVHCPHYGHSTTALLPPKLINKICKNPECKTVHKAEKYIKIEDVKFCKNCRGEFFEFIYQ